MSSRAASLGPWLVAASLFAAPACTRGGSSLTPSGDAAVDADGGAGAVACPTSVPPDGGGCDAQTLVCEYGNDPNRDCRTFAQCDPNRNCRTVDDCAVLARWTVTVADGGACPSTGASACPTSLDAASGAPCAEKDAWCAWPDGGTCLCTNCRPGPIGPNCADSATWECTFSQPGCPATMPRAGDPCAPPSSAEPLLCEYGCMFGARRCQGGVWVTEPGICPQSRRAMKRDIEYLGPDDIERLAAETTRLRLATYAYRSPAHGAGRQLGFIIDDAPGTPAVNGDTVDLYGFASMLLATSQAQARKIAALEREVARLRRALPKAR